MGREGPGHLDGSAAEGDTRFAAPRVGWAVAVLILAGCTSAARSGSPGPGSAAPSGSLPPDAVVTATVVPAAVVAGDVFVVTPSAVINRRCADSATVDRFTDDGGLAAVGMITGTSWQLAGPDTTILACAQNPNDRSARYTTRDLPAGRYRVCLVDAPEGCAAIQVRVA